MKRITNRTRDDRLKWLKIGCLVLLGIIAILAGVRGYLYGEKSASTSVKGKDVPISSVDTQEKKVSLSFDIGSSDKGLQEVLKVLADRDIFATFFVTGCWVTEYPEEVKELADIGHELGNHTQNHKRMGEYTKDQIEDELMVTHDKVKDITGINMSLFRPPYADYSNKVIQTATAFGYKTVLWDVDSLDWKEYSADIIKKNVIKNRQLGNGSIILLHTDARNTTEALAGIIDDLTKNGYEIVPISKLLYQDDFHMNKSGEQIKNK